MPEKLGPRAERDTALGWSNSLGVRLRLASYDPDLSRLAEALGDSDDLPAGLTSLIGRMRRPAAAHPALAAGSPAGARP